MLHEDTEAIKGCLHGIHAGKDSLTRSILERMLSPPQSQTGKIIVAKFA